MSREIKFRVWNGSEMTFIEDLYWFEENMIHSVDDIPEHGAIMQYTGLKDKNDVGVYEGDVVHFRADGLSGYGTVYYDPETARFRIRDVRGKNTRRGIREYEFYRNCVLRVDGNIYEHPNLLSGADAEDGGERARMDS